MSSLPLLDRVLQEAEARQLPSVIHDWTASRPDALDERHWIARALQLDLPLLIERPELVLPCLHRRCSFLGETEYYPDRGPPPAQAGGLEAMIESWIAAAAPARWLRALRPPYHALDAGVIEEYRTSIEGDVRFSADGGIVGVVGKESAIAWDRSTGRRVADPLGNLPPVRPPRWQHDRAKGWIILHSGPTRWELRTQLEDESVFSPVELSDDLVIVNCSYEDDPYDMHSTYAHYLVDVSAGRILWRANDTCFDAALAGDAIRESSKGIALRSIATGEELAVASIPYSRSIAFAGGGSLVATRDLCVIRIWDLAAAPSRVPTGRAGGGRLSPDSTRLLAGNALWDAQTGELIAPIPFSGQGNWLEGGPPGNAWDIVNRRVVQVMPSDTTVWDSADGQQLAELPVRAGASDSVRSDPDGRYLATIRARDRQLTIHSLDDGALLFETAARVVSRGFRDHLFGWSNSGELWWETDDGEAHVLSSSTWVARRLPRGAPVPEVPSRELAIGDGLLVVGDVTAPMDSTTADASRDGRIFVGGDHYRLEGA